MPPVKTQLKRRVPNRDKHIWNPSPPFQFVGILYMSHYVARIYNFCWTFRGLICLFFLSDLITLTFLLGSQLDTQDCFSICVQFILK